VIYYKCRKKRGEAPRRDKRDKILKVMDGGMAQGRIVGKLRYNLRQTIKVWHPLLEKPSFILLSRLIGPVNAVGTITPLNIKVYSGG
jgi:hypothetical protein